MFRERLDGWGHGEGILNCDLVFHAFVHAALKLFYADASLDIALLFDAAICICELKPQLFT